MSKSKKEMYKQIYKVTYIANINYMIDESRYIDVLQKISMDGFKTYHIENFDKLILHMQSIGLNDSFNISMLMHLRDTNYKKISEIALLFTEIGEIFACKKKSMVDRINKIRKIIKEKLDIIRAFGKLDKVVLANPNSEQFILTNFNTDKKISDRKIEDEWIYYSKRDIIDRLHLIAQKHYNIDQLKYMDIDLKYASEIDSMDHKNLELYYLSTINIIESCLKEWITICRLYVDIEINYIECCDNMIKGNTTSLNLKHFNIDIKNNENNDNNDNNENTQ